MSTLRCCENGADVEADKFTPFLCMKLMHSSNPKEVETVRNELLKAGIAVEVRHRPVPDNPGRPEMELWVQDERDFFPAAEVYACVKERAFTKNQKPNDPPWWANEENPRANNEPPREELEHASSLLEEEIEGLLQRETALLAECSSLRITTDELRRVVEESQAALTREAETREAAGHKQAEKISRLESTLEGERAARIFAEEQLARERKEWEQHLTSRDQSVKQAQEELASKSRLLENQEAALTDLRATVEALALQRDEADRAFSQAQTEVATERQARQAAEVKVERAVEAQKSLEQQLQEQKRLEKRLQAHLASINSLCSRLQAKRAALVDH